MTWGPLGGQKSLNNRPIPDFLGSDQGGRGQEYPSHERAGYSPTPPLEGVPPHAAPGYGSYRHPLVTLSLTKKSIFFLFLAFVLSVTFAFIIGFAMSFMMFSQNVQGIPNPQKNASVLSKKQNGAALASNKKKIIIQPEENDLDDEELE